jgi:hypothetical protein
MKKIGFAVASVFALAFVSSPAAAQVNGSGVSVGRDVNITVRQEAAQTAVAIGENAHARNVAGVIAGDVSIGRDANINVRQEAAVTAVAIGSNVSATNAAGVVTSKPLW